MKCPKSKFPIWIIVYTQPTKQTFYEYNFIVHLFHGLYLFNSKSRFYISLVGIKLLFLRKAFSTLLSSAWSISDQLI